MPDDRVAIQVEGGLIVAYPPEGNEFWGVRKDAKVVFMPSQSLSSQSAPILGCPLASASTLAPRYTPGTM